MSVSLCVCLCDWKHRHCRSIWLLLTCCLARRCGRRAAHYYYPDCFSFFAQKTIEKHAENVPIRLALYHRNGKHMIFVPTVAYIRLLSLPKALYFCLFACAVLCATNCLVYCNENKEEKSHIKTTRHIILISSSLKSLQNFIYLLFVSQLFSVALIVSLLPLLLFLIFQNIYKMHNYYVCCTVLCWVYFNFCFRVLYLYR